MSIIKTTKTYNRVAITDTNVLRLQTENEDEHINHEEHNYTYIIQIGMTEYSMCYLVIPYFYISYNMINTIKIILDGLEQYKIPFEIAKDILRIYVQSLIPFSIDIYNMTYFTQMDIPRYIIDNYNYDNDSNSITYNIELNTEYSFDYIKTLIKSKKMRFGISDYFVNTCDIDLVSKKEIEEINEIIRFFSLNDNSIDDNEDDRKFRNYMRGFTSILV